MSETHAPEIMTPSTVALSYLPLSHMMEEVCHWTLPVYKARVGFYSGSIPKQLGGNVNLMVKRSAPISEEVRQTYKLALGSSIIGGYGQTECTAIETLSRPGDWTGGRCGGVEPCCNIKLADVPELNYYVKDRRGKVGQ
ncbi:hypothetical protein OESDEN_19864 [Oesophagostomum dentatum]|uniref:long-chain-fatty-acid--CoA ligase n=1 Tax=Oesophagostomum dentatum TaxID=61180 RepID=A0A0B1S979_OESDE|nr:hypothetical protein OESDEN_19864 [Oesophagostomum dentatum]